jgi:hypothetical protein
MADAEAAGNRRTFPKRSLNRWSRRTTRRLRERPATTASNAATGCSGAAARHGLFCIGCLTLLIIGFVLIAGVVGGTWYVCRKAADKLTSSQPVDLGIVPPDEAQVRNAEKSVTASKPRSRPSRKQPLPSPPRT